MQRPVGRETPRLPARRTPWERGDDQQTRGAGREGADPPRRPGHVGFPGVGVFTGRLRGSSSTENPSRDADFRGLVQWSVTATGTRTKAKEAAPRRALWQMLEQ